PAAGDGRVYMTATLPHSYCARISRKPRADFFYCAFFGRLQRGWRTEEEIMPELKGGCLCGAGRYWTTAEPLTSTVCHCRDCQRFTGSAFGALVYVPKETLTIEGMTKTFTSLGGSGKPMLRHFCPECGSTIAQEPGTRPGVVVLHVG